MRCNEAQLAAGAKEKEAHSFEIDPAQVKIVKQRCLLNALNYPMLEKYDFRNDTAEQGLASYAKLMGREKHFDFQCSNKSTTYVFTYNKQFHNVMQVTHADYRSCNVSAPITTHSTGNDSITIKTYGHHFFLCAVPGHCQSGQKLDINVEHVSPTSAPSPSTSDPTLASLPAPSPGPTSVAASNPNAVGKGCSSTVSVMTTVGMALAMFVGVV